MQMYNIYMQIYSSFDESYVSRQFDLCSIRFIHKLSSLKPCHEVCGSLTVNQKYFIFFLPSFICSSWQLEILFPQLLISSHFVLSSTLHHSEETGFSSSRSPPPIFPLWFLSFIFCFCLFFFLWFNFHCSPFVKKARNIRITIISFQPQQLCS